MRTTKEVVRQKIIATRDLIKCHPLTPELATELFTSKGMNEDCRNHHGSGSRSRNWDAL